MAVVGQSAAQLPALLPRRSPARQPVVSFTLNQYTGTCGRQHLRRHLPPPPASCSVPGTATNRSPRPTRRESFRTSGNRQRAITAHDLGAGNVLELKLGGKVPSEGLKPEGLKPPAQAAPVLVV